jgi:hypothetical protein
MHKNSYILEKVAQKVFEYVVGIKFHNSVSFYAIKLLFTPKWSKWGYIENGATPSTLY